MQTSQWLPVFLPSFFSFLWFFTKSSLGSREGTGVPGTWHFLPQSKASAPFFGGRQYRGAAAEPLEAIRGKSQGLGVHTYLQPRYPMGRGQTLRQAVWLAFTHTHSTAHSGDSQDGNNSLRNIYKVSLQLFLLETWPWAAQVNSTSVSSQVSGPSTLRGSV